MAEPAALYEKKNGIALVTTKRPEAHNAINAEIVDANGPFAGA